MFSKNLSHNKIKKIKPKIIFFIFWSKKINKKIYENYHCIQFHSSDLPKFRGGSPIQNQILSGIIKTKITAFRVNQKIVGGDICMKKKLNLNGDANKIYLDIEKKVIQMILKITKLKKIKYVKQKNNGTYFKRRMPKDSNLSIISHKNIGTIYNFIRMLDSNDYPRAFFLLGNKKIIFKNAKLKKDILTGNFELKIFR